jgi:uncharacterized protein YycO
VYKPQVGDYLVVKTNGIAAKLIRLGTLSRWNHAAIVVSVDGDVPLIVEARPTGVALKPINQYTSVAFNQHEELTPKQRQDIVEHANKQVGKPYGFLDILIIALRILGLRLPPVKLWTRIAKHQGYICSELVAECYQKAGMALSDKDACLVTPGDLAERLIYQ